MLLCALMYTSKMKKTTKPRNRIVFKKVIANITQDGRLKMKDAALYLGVSYVTLRRNYRKLDWPAGYRIGKGVFFFKKDLDMWIRSNLEC